MSRFGGKCSQVRELTVAEYMLCGIKLLCAASGVHILLFVAFMIARSVSHLECDSAAGMCCHDGFNNTSVDFSVREQCVI